MLNKALLAARNRLKALVLDADPTFRGPVLDASAVSPRYRSWVADPASADRVGRYRSGTPYRPLSDQPFSGIFNFARASTAWDFDATGSLTAVASGAIRQGYDSTTLLPAGWLVEGASANIVPNSSNFSGATGTTFPSGWSANGLVGGTVTIVNSGVESGMNFVDVQYNGTNSGGSITYPALNFMPGGTGSAANGQTWTTSLYARTIAGTAPATVYMYVAEFQGTTFLAAHGLPISSLPGGPLAQQRFAGTTALTQAATTGLGMYINFPLAASASVNWTVRYSMPQVELNYCASSPIPTTGTSVTRAQDSLSITGTAFTGLFGRGAPQGFAICEFLEPVVSSTVLSRILCLHDGSTLNSIEVYQNGGASITALQSIINNVPSAVTGPAIAANMITRVGMRWGSTGASFCINGGTVLTLAGTVPPGLNTLSLFNRADGNRPLNGRIRLARAGAYVPSDAAFQAMCVVGA